MSRDPVGPGGARTRTHITVACLRGSPPFPLSAKSSDTVHHPPDLPCPCLLWPRPPHPPAYLSSWKQWAAVITQRSAMRAPPQMCRPRTWRLACHGHSPSEDTAPPTMRLEGPWRPQSGDGGRWWGGQRRRGRGEADKQRGRAKERDGETENRRTMEGERS